MKNKKVKTRRNRKRNSYWRNIRSTKSSLVGRPSTSRLTESASRFRSSSCWAACKAGAALVSSRICRCLSDSAVGRDWRWCSSEERRLWPLMADGEDGEMGVVSMAELFSWLVWWKTRLTCLGSENVKKNKYKMRVLFLVFKRHCRVFPFINAAVASAVAVAIVA